MLHDAARQGNPDIIRLLIVYEAEVEARDSQGNTPLHQAMAAGHERAMWVLVDVGKADLKRCAYQLGRSFRSLVIQEC